MYVLGGSDGQSALACVEIFDFEANAWSHGPNLSVPRANVAAAVVDQRLYAVGGFSGKLFLNSIETLQRDLREWSTFVPRLHAGDSSSGGESECDNSTQRNSRASNAPLHSKIPTMQHSTNKTNGLATKPAVKPVLADSLQNGIEVNGCDDTNGATSTSKPPVESGDMVSAAANTCQITTNGVTSKVVSEVNATS